jgi:hypothetical protein
MGKWMFHCHILEHAERGMMGAQNGSSPEPSSRFPSASGCEIYG